MRSLLPDTRLLREREFRLLYSGQAVSSFGSALTYVALPLQMYQLTHSTVLVGLLGLVEFLADCSFWPSSVERWRTASTAGDWPFMRNG